LAYLTWDNVDLEQRFALVHDSKSGDARTVILTKRVAKCLADLPYGKYVFRRSRHQDKPYSLNALSNVIRSIFKKAGLLHVDRPGLHCLRRTFTARCAELGVPMPVVRDQLGHASLATTERHYLSVSEAAAMRKSLEILEE
jgi:integrase